MSNRVANVLIICSNFDAYALEEDGGLEAQMMNEYLGLNLSHPPKFCRVSSASEAYELLKNGEKYDLIITMLNIGEIDAFTFAKTVKTEYLNVPIVLLAHFSREVSIKLEKEDLSGIDYVFCWMGNTDLILAIIKLIEDMMNADQDISETGIQAILLVEDSIKYYSTYLPIIYKLLLHQSSELVKEAMNEHEQMLRKRARPKILLARTLEEATTIYEKYGSNLLGVISDISFKRDAHSKVNSEGGIELCKMIKAINPQLPYLLQSSRLEAAEKAKQYNVEFLHKYSKTLILELTSYITKEFLFGDFIFTDVKTKEEIGRASNLRELQRFVRDIDSESLIYHTSRNHLSKWMFARGLFSLAKALKTVQDKQFDNPQKMRELILTSIDDYRSLLGQGVIAKFNSSTYNKYVWFAKIGEGSIGGKARGLAYINSMLNQHKLFNKYEKVRITIPRTVVIATDYFDEFITQNGLQYVINADNDDNDILSEFIGSRLSESLVKNLRAFINSIKSPIAVRSSSKLEDSHFQPFAGVYSTYMIPYVEDKNQMLRMLAKAIKSVYASVFYSASRAYILASSSVISEEKMAVVLQEVCGTEENGLYFPTVSGVARSINFYPVEEEKPEDGVANIAFGLGKLVVEGGKTLRFSPKHPKKVMQLSTPEMTLSDTQRDIYALDLSADKFKMSTDDAVNLVKLDVLQASNLRNMRNVCSIWDRQNNRISDSLFTEGRKLITFAGILKYDSFPLADIVSTLLDIGRDDMKTQVEIEFAVNLDVPYGENRIFNCLQIRPIVEDMQNNVINWGEINTESPIIYANQALGLGRIRGIRDVIYVKEDAFDPANTCTIAREIEKLNNIMREKGKNYVLIGPGRWGSSDSWLGIPVKWSNISEAMVIVESGLADYRIDPSQGTHFFQNLTSFGVGYVTLNSHIGDGVFDCAQLDALEAVNETDNIRHVKFSQPLTIFVDGKSGKAIVTTKKKLEN
ncbi:MAG: PEP/pyruvate-binding domain-containing protein [Rikenellaceae bacterium]